MRGWQCDTRALTLSPYSRGSYHQTEVHYGGVKVSDFGFAAESTGEDLKTKLGSPLYMAPEVVAVKETRRRYGKKCDLWAVGVMAYVLLCGAYPFPGDTVQEIFANVRAGAYPPMRGGAWETAPESAKDFIAQLLVPACSRPTAPQALEHPWLQSRAAPPAARGGAEEAGSDADADPDARGAAASAAAMACAAEEVERGGSWGAGAAQGCVLQLSMCPWLPTNEGLNPGYWGSMRSASPYASPCASPYASPYASPTGSPCISPQSRPCPIPPTSPSPLCLHASASWASPVGSPVADENLRSRRRTYPMALDHSGSFSEAVDLSASYPLLSPSASMNSSLSAGQPAYELLSPMGSSMGRMQAPTFSFPHVAAPQVCVDQAFTIPDASVVVGIE